MRDVRRIGRRTWLARLGGGALAVVAGLKVGGREGYGIRIDVPAAGLAHAQGHGAGHGAGHTPGHGADHGGMAHGGMAHDGIAHDARRIPLGQGGFTTAYLLIAGNEAALVDTGVAGSAERIGEVAREAGLSWDGIKHVILTHHHPDHAGSVGEVLGLAPAATVWAGAADIPSIQAAQNIQPAADGDEVFGLRIVATPGHTAGHISVYDPHASALILGDAAVNVGGTLAAPSERFTADMAQAQESLRKIAGLAFETAWFMHGEPIQGGASAAFAGLVARLGEPGGAHATAHALGLPHDHACL
jgi:glyoxylase-like metal-dependent hydrolase (beta-lactamase superfamily II)